jgi:Domain of unknown function (DUF4156)/Short C-terminal domain
VRRSFLLLFVTSALSAGCYSDLSASGAAVRIGKLEPLGCRELGTVYGSGGGGPYTSSQTKLESAQNELRNQTAGKGGNYVVMDVSSADQRGLTLSGRAFQCADREMVADRAPPPPPPQAAPPNAAPAPPTATPEERLAKLKELLDKKLITQEEYDKRRAEIVGSI